ncbi:MAG: insulinase family protein [Candidatus Azobacteroides sp.]|nr:insulinase family protein [Candidatus Azobacteroides sp.]
MISINYHLLNNGLRIVHHKDVSTQMVALNILYDVGSKDENPDQTGLAHLFEHLMFGGSVHIPEYDMPLQYAGGENNAWTNSDMTNYYLTIPRQNVETGFWLESDRMLSLAFTQKSLEVQKQVVIEEFKQRYLNQPYGDVPALLRELAYKVHPYRWATIGKEIFHIEQVNLDDAKNFFFTHYAPNNAILSVSGNIEFEEVVSLSGKWFGPIPERNIKRRCLLQEPVQNEARLLEVERDVPLDAVFKAYKMPARTAPDFYAYDILSDVLANGRSSRLYRQLVMEKKLFSEANAYVSGDLEPGLFFVTGKPVAGVSLKEADELLCEELEVLRHEPISDREAEKVKNKFESNELFGNINYLNKAANMAFYELIGNAGDINRQVDLYRNISTGQIKEAANKTFRPENCSTIYYKAGKTCR